MDRYDKRIWAVRIAAVIIIVAIILVICLGTPGGPESDPEAFDLLSVVIAMILVFSASNYLHKKFDVGVGGFLLFLFFYIPVGGFLTLLIRTLLIMIERKTQGY